MQDAVTAIILVETEVSPTALAQTLKTLGWPAEILVADAVGLNLSGLAQETAFVHLPLIGFSNPLLRYRAALAAQGCYLLFLRPGDQITPEARTEIGRLVKHSQLAPAGYAFARQWVWHDIAWRMPANTAQPDFIQREAFLQEGVIRQHEVTTVLDKPLQHLVGDEGLLNGLWQDASIEACERLARDGLPYIKEAMMFSWFRETLWRGVTEGIVGGRLFRGHAQRLALFLAIIRAHLVWFCLYGYVRCNRPTP